MGNDTKGLFEDVPSVTEILINGCSSKNTDISFASALAIDYLSYFGANAKIKIILLLPKLWIRISEMARQMSVVRVLE
jgi:hypothetical protein